MLTRADFQEFMYMYNELLALLLRHHASHRSRSGEYDDGASVLVRQMNTSLPVHY